MTRGKGEDGNPEREGEDREREKITHDKLVLFWDRAISPWNLGTSCFHRKFCKIRIGAGASLRITKFYENSSDLRSQGQISINTKVVRCRLLNPYQGGDFLIKGCSN